MNDLLILTTVLWDRGHFGPQSADVETEWEPSAGQRAARERGVWPPAPDFVTSWHCPLWLRGELARLFTVPFFPAIAPGGQPLVPPHLLRTWVREGQFAPRPQGVPAARRREGREEGLVQGAWGSELDTLSQGEVAEPVAGGYWQEPTDVLLPQGSLFISSPLHSHVSVALEALLSWEVLQQK